MKTVDELRAALDYQTPPAAPDPGAIISRAPRQRTVRRRTVLAASVVTIAALGIGFGVAPIRGGGARPAAAAVLDHAAARAAAHTGPANDGAVWFTETRRDELGLDTATDPVTDTVVGRAFLVQRRITTRVWLALPDRQRTDQAAERPTVAPPDEAAWIAAGRPPFTAPASFTDDPGTKDTWQLLLDNELGGTSANLRREVELLTSLPTNPAKLAQWLRKRVTADAPGQSLVQWCPIDAGSCGADAKVFHAAAALLTTPAAPAALRSALFRVIAGLPDVRIDGTTADDAGRPATAVTMTMGHLRHELLLDPDRAALLATRQVLVTAPHATEDHPQWTAAAVGSIVQSTLYLHSRTVTSIGSTT
jgi:hypothetical protein